MIVKDTTTTWPNIHSPELISIVVVIGFGPVVVVIEPEVDVIIEPETAAIVEEAPAVKAVQIKKCMNKIR